MKPRKFLIGPGIVLLTLAACSQAATTTGPTPAAAEPASAPVAPPDEVSRPNAATFVAQTESELARLSEQASRASWVQANFITHDTELLASRALEDYTVARTQAAETAAEYVDEPTLAPDVERRLTILRTGLTMPAPSDSARAAEMTRLATSLDAAYGRGKWCPANAPRPRLTGGPEDDDNPWADACLDVGEITEVMATSRDPEELRTVWQGWRTISPGMRDDYTRFVQLMNEGARELGFADVGALWRSGYDMTPAELEAELNRLWQQVKPLYDDLHCYVRGELSDFYGADVVPLDGPIPAHLLGNIWAQDWANVFDIVAPSDAASETFDLTAALREHDYDALDMVRTAENFFTSMGFAPLPQTFWERSLFVQPRDRDVVCHASAWNLDDEDDLRIKMCITPTAEDFQTIHHELGHNFYQRAYNEQPWLFRGGAHDGFHEAIGDAIALSITPAYLVGIGLMDEEPASGDIGLLLGSALSKVAFLPFGLLVDQWRWDVFSGEITPDDYNRAWWDLRERYQGVAAAPARGEAFFDPGAKYHIPGNTPYTRYFLAHVLQFQFLRAMCELAGNEGPLHRCSFYGSEEAGRALNAMLEMGQSRDWRDALEALTGTREMDATALVDYYAPLQSWLREENAGRECGW